MKYLHKLQAGEKRVQSLLTLHANLAASYLPVPVQRYWAIPEKKQTGGLRTYFLKNPVFHFFYFTPGNSRQKASPPDTRNSTNFC